jgi:hypothetical protein
MNDLEEFRLLGCGARRVNLVLNRRSSEMSVHTRFTRRHTPEDGIIHSHRRENLKSYMNDLVRNLNLFKNTGNFGF